MGMERFGCNFMTATTVAIIATNTNFITITVTLTTVDEFSIAVIKFKNSEG